MATGETMCVFVTTNSETRLGLLMDRDDSVSVFKDKICVEHEHCFPNFGKVKISALKVKWGDNFYYLSDSMVLSEAYKAISKNAPFILAADVMRVEDKAGELLMTKIAASSKPDVTLQIHEPVDNSKKRKLKTSASSSKSVKKPALGDKGEVQEIATGKVTHDQEKDFAHTLELVDDVKESHKDEFVSGTIAKALTATESLQTENQGLIVRVDANETEIGTKEVGEKAVEEVKSVKPKKKTKTKKAKAPKAKEDPGQVASTSQNVEPALVVKDPLENLDNLVKNIVEEA